MLTEAEAKEKWCPFARVGVRGNNENQSDRDWRGVSFNRAILLNNDKDNREYRTDWPKCIGSACMAWRTREIASPNQSLDDGFCGLAGKPI